MEIIIREAELKDVNEILKIVNFEILHSTVLYDYNERTYEQQLTWFNQKQIDLMPIIVAEYNRRIVGFGTFGIFRPWPAYQFSVEHSVYVEKNFRKVGIGKRLIIKLIAIAKERGFHTMIAGVDGSNELSFDFHKKLGFKEIGTFKEVGFKFDKWLDLRFLQLILD